MKRNADNVVALDTLTPDPQNRRKRTPRNVEMIAASLRDVGTGRSIVIDERGEVIAGNGVLEAAPAAGVSKVQIIDADGDTIIAVRRSNLTPEQKRAMALYDNRTAELAEWDAEQLRADADAGLPLQPWFSDAEIVRFTAGLPSGEPQAEPTTASEVRIEILCTKADLADLAGTLDEWNKRGTVEVRIA